MCIRDSLDDRTWTSGETTAKLIAEIESGMAEGIHMLCVHEFPSVVGPPRHACDFAKMFDDDWTPQHLQKGEKNLYNEIALALKGAEWRKPGFVAFASKIAASGGTIQAGHSEDKKVKGKKVKAKKANAPAVVVAAEATGDLELLEA